MAENIRRGFGPTAVNGRKSHCIRGHELSGSNLFVYPTGKRGCRECRAAAAKCYVRRNPEAYKAWDREYQRRKRAARAALLAALRGETVNDEGGKKGGE